MGITTGSTENVGREIGLSWQYASRLSRLYCLKIQINGPGMMELSQIIGKLYPFISIGWHNHYGIWVGSANFIVIISDRNLRKHSEATSAMDFWCPSELTTKKETIKVGNTI